MYETYSGTHIDPFAKLKFGWLRPQLIVRSGHYSLPSIETERFVWILIDLAHSTYEYYIVENRWRGTSYDKMMPDAGRLAIWHMYTYLLILFAKYWIKDFNARGIFRKLYTLQIYQ